METDIINVLLLEDDETRIKKFIRNFNQNNLSYMVVKNAKDCLNILKHKKFHYVFLDHDLGGEQMVDAKDTNTGSEVARQWKEIIGDSDLPMMVIIHSFNPIGGEYMNNLIPNSVRFPGVWDKEECFATLKDGIS